MSNIKTKIIKQSMRNSINDPYKDMMYFQSSSPIIQRNGKDKPINNGIKFNAELKKNVEDYNQKVKIYNSKQNINRRLDNRNYGIAFNKDIELPNLSEQKRHISSFDERNKSNQRSKAKNTDRNDRVKFNKPMKFSLERLEVFDNRNRDRNADTNLKRIKQAFKNARYVDSYHITPMNAKSMRADNKSYVSHTIQSHFKYETKDYITSDDIVKAIESKRKPEKRDIPSNMKTTERKEDASKFMNPPNDVMRKIVKKVSDSKLFNPNSKEAMMPKSISSVKQHDDPIFKGIPNPNYESKVAYGWEKMFKGILSPYSNIYKNGINEIVSTYQVELDK